LTGAHAQVACAQCHTNGNYNLTTTACVSCHLKDFQGTTNPNHATAGIPQQCEVCHSTSAWQPATFDHSKTGFPLTGAHVGVTCAQCHTNGNYNLASTTCVSCHLKDFQNTNNPNHLGHFPRSHSSTRRVVACNFGSPKTRFRSWSVHVADVCAVPRTKTTTRQHDLRQLPFEGFRTRTTQTTRRPASRSSARSAIRPRTGMRHLSITRRPDGP
jgi:hypothetical protein